MVFVVLWCLWYCGIVVLWYCGIVVLWCCGIVVLWCCGVVVFPISSSRFFEKKRDSLRCGVVVSGFPPPFSFPPSQ